MYDVINSRYTYKGTDVLVNKLDIKDEKKLEKYERKMVAFKLATINEVEFPKVFDEKRLKFIHSYLFCDVYDFAGMYRLENIIKENFVFSQYEYIEENLKSDITTTIDGKKFLVNINKGLHVIYLKDITIEDMQRTLEREMEEPYVNLFVNLCLSVVMKLTFQKLSMMRL